MSVESQVGFLGGTDKDVGTEVADGLDPCGERPSTRPCAKRRCHVGLRLTVVGTPCEIERQFNGTGDIDLRRRHVLEARPVVPRRAPDVDVAGVERHATWLVGLVLNGIEDHVAVTQLDPRPVARVEEVGGD